jgi:uncharacterized membrane protein
VLAVTVIGGVALAVAQTWLVENWLNQGVRTPLFLASAVLVALVATMTATAFRAPVPTSDRKVSAVMIGVIVVLLVLAILLLLTVYFVASAFSTFS